MVRFCMLVGLPGSGKSTYAEKLKEEGYVIHSSDKIREELGDVNDQSKNNEVFEMLRKRVKSDLQAGRNVAIDATNLNRRKRVAFLREIKKIPCYRIAVLLATPREVCLANNFKRDRKVPEEVLDRMYKNFQIPSCAEGWDEVYIHYSNEYWKTYYGNPYITVQKLCNYNQNNKHHRLSLGHHMFMTEEYIRSYNYDGKDMELQYAALLHDIGKPITRSNKDKKGNITKEAHYFNHMFAGSYDSLFYDIPGHLNRIKIALLIEFHMHPYLAWKQSEKAMQKDVEMFGEDFVAEVMILHRADLAAH